MKGNQNREKQTLCLYPRMTGAGMIHRASVFAATMLAAVRRDKWFSEIYIHVQPYTITNRNQ